MALLFTTSLLEDSIAQLRHYKSLADRAITQIADDQHLTAVLDGEMNSIATIVKHLAGNMRSRWTNFLTTDGEKPERHRDGEFVDPPATREALLALWEEGWRTLFDSLAQLTDDDLSRRITIRGEAHSVTQAIARTLAHTAYHCGQIVLLAKHFSAAHWQSLTVPRGQSEEFNRRVTAGEASQR